MTENERQGMFVTLEQRVEISKCFAELDEYRAIGTIEEFKELKEKNEPRKTNSFSGCIHNNVESDWDFAK